MLDFYFKYPRVLRRLREGALGNEMDRIAAHFFELGYDPASARSTLVDSPSSASSPPEVREQRGSTRM